MRRPVRNLRAGGTYAAAAVIAAGAAVPLPAVAVCAQNRAGVFQAAQTAVVARQHADEVAVFQIAVMAQDGAAVAQVGAHVKQVVAFVADVALPKGHHLHQPFCAHVADGVLAKAAFHFD